MIGRGLEAPSGRFGPTLCARWNSNGGSKVSEVILGRTELRKAWTFGPSSFSGIPKRPYALRRDSGGCCRMMVQAVSREKVIEEDGLRLGLTGNSQAAPSLAGLLPQKPRGAHSAVACSGHCAHRPPCDTAAVLGIFRGRAGQSKEKHDKERS
ncbi:hypothetical protein NDU88_003843 [Pleurodeles waltl]|uniref:Uncharacterized protein n=1 Tax=Pleurodeles waltl TaxID=8319 RepID=A0AAV7L2Y4_PLEWA|nr:hypothetical protein NDU88_003843 [Pleurodeles waltl]